MCSGKNERRSDRQICEELRHSESGASDVRQQRHGAGAGRECRRHHSFRGHDICSSCFRGFRYGRHQLRLLLRNNPFPATSGTSWANTENRRWDDVHRQSLRSATQYDIFLPSVCRAKRHVLLRQHLFLPHRRRADEHRRRGFPEPVCQSRRDSAEGRRR